MRPLMPPVQTPDNLFHDGNPLTGELGTIVDAEHLNNEQAAIRDTQSELIAILTAAAMEPESTAGQLLAALNKLYAPLNDTLGALSSLVGGANKLPYFTSANAAALTALSSIGRDIVGKATVADVLTYLGLGEGAKLGAAVCVTGSTGYMTIPAMVAGKERVIILQWFGVVTTDYVTPVTANFPIAFPNECMIPLFSDVSTGAVDLSSTTAYNLAVGRAYYTTVTRTQITCAGYGGFRVFAIGW
ncbi:gp53-like domain-containing protein [Citrobacter farmeri]